MTLIELKTSGTHEKGIFAKSEIKKGDHIITFSGPLLHRSEVDFNDYHLQVGEEHYLGPSRDLDDYINHSCSPNSGFSEGLKLIALTDIAIGEEITWDYSTAIDEPGFPGIPCRCGSNVCRGEITSYRHLPAEIQGRLAPYLLPYLKQKYMDIVEAI